MIKIVVTGSCGRMGRTIINLAHNDKAIKVVGEVDMDDDLANALKGADALIDFTLAKAAMGNLEIALKLKKAMVIGTTGFNDKELKKIKEASEKIPIVLSPNMAVGVNLLFGIVGQLAKKLGKNYDIEITEAHHNKKKDAPSGTAKGLAAEIEKETGRKVSMHAIRAGDIIGDHTVFYAGCGERIEITHPAQSRDHFATGAIKAAKWIVGKKPKLYNMRDVLGV